MGLGVLAVPGYMLLDFGMDLVCDVNEVASMRGQGLTSKVIKGKLAAPRLIEKHGDIPIAIKLMNQGEEAHNDEYLYEVAIMSMFPPCPYIVRLIGYSENPRAIIMKHYPISLKLLLKSSELNASPVLRLKIGYDIAHGMNIIHRCGVLHLDLKPRKQNHIIMNKHCL